ncbi:hypothetical protein [Pararhizobium sp. A13]|uniref:hypothetical protein n=1 Tax=Pararhizobium sp. A13 TaxID=3133975 RepID=UPI0032543990
MSTIENARTADTCRSRDLWEEGKASGKPKPVDFDNLREQARQDLVAAQIQGR